MNKEETIQEIMCIFKDYMNERKDIKELFNNATNDKDNVEAHILWNKITKIHERELYNNIDKLLDEFIN